MSGEKVTDLIDVHAIGRDVSIAMFLPDKDEKCPFKPMQEIKVDYIKWYGNVKHGHFSTFKDPEFVNELIAQL